MVVLPSFSKGADNMKWKSLRHQLQAPVPSIVAVVFMYAPKPVAMLPVSSNAENEHGDESVK